ncbi:AraC family transcriptional regulator [Segnochrobactrum spirostomi]|uniref:AraC family transcriptional regulator n=1 Tax=Segnochrobactrum spirostomi TaxID=2608987 RepID=A0A6A7Y9R4_9HYPH|nr:AraC family transcriptional regulator [Segnochrobactrum spirostomi]MQT15107.1 AraC family transcriptional regulator [Segnochrobactrum spirostomi]
MEESISRLADLIARHCDVSRWTTPIPRLTLLRSDTPTMPIGVTYNPVVCFIAQGAKRAILGERVFDYDPAHYLVASVDLPVTGGISRASPQEPYLAASLALDRSLLATMLLEMGDGPRSTDPQPGMAVTAMTPDLLDSLIRLVSLLDRPTDAAMLAPLVEREILYRLLCGEQGALLRQIALADSSVSRVSRVITWIRANFAKPLRIELLAEIAGMSASSLHRHFKAVTTMSPLQYQKQLRLQEARRLLLSQHVDAASIGFSVGYESPSQFSREYSRLFGAPPARDATRLRALTGAGLAPFSPAP